MNSRQRYISFGLIILLAGTVGSWLFYTHSSTFWNKDLETSFPSTIWLVICLLLTILIFVTAYYATKAVGKAAGLPVWAATIATPALAIPALNFSTGFLFARLNGIDNVHGFPLSRPSDLLADEIFLIIVGSLSGLSVYLLSLLVSWIVGKFRQSAQLR